jgi:tRNA A37 N6-isopentenylltransferase MiaA
MRYARRQAIWFRGEPGVQWIPGPGETTAARDAALAIVRQWLAETAGSEKPAYI